MKQPHTENRDQQSQVLSVKVVELVKLLARMAAERDFVLLANNGSEPDHNERRN